MNEFYPGGFPVIFETDLETMIVNVRGWNRRYDLEVKWSGHFGSRAAWVIGDDVVTAESVGPDLVHVGVILYSKRRDLDEWEPWNGNLLDYYRSEKPRASSRHGDGENDRNRSNTGWKRLFEYLNGNFPMLDIKEQRKRLPDESDLHVRKVLDGQGVTYDLDEEKKFQQGRDREAAMSPEEAAKEFIEGGCDVDAGKEIEQRRQGERKISDWRIRRAKLFKAIKDANPSLSYPQVAMKANLEYEDVLKDIDKYPVYEHTVTNDYKAMGWKWERADRIR